MFEGNPPQFVYTDDSSGFRKAVRKTLKTTHRGCGFHVFQKWKVRFHKFKSQKDIRKAKTLLFKAITCIDPVGNDKHWGELLAICRKNLPGAKHESFLSYYDKNRHFWSLKGIPRAAFSGESFANSITESANNMVKRQGICDAKSTLRVIYIASAKFDPSVVNPEAMHNPPVITPRIPKAKEDRKGLLKSLQDVSCPMQWREIPDMLTDTCVKRLVKSFQRSAKYSVCKINERTFHVLHQGRDTDPICVVKMNQENKLVCVSCHHINMFGSPCPHTLAAAKIFNATEESCLPFVDRCFRSQAAPTTLTEMFHGDGLDPVCTGLDDDTIGVEDIVDQADEHSKHSDVHENEKECESCYDFDEDSDSNVYLQEPSTSRETQWPRKSALQCKLEPKVKRPGNGS